MSLYDLAAAGLRRIDPETAHDLTIRALKLGLGPRSRLPQDPILETEVGGLRLPNCVGLAAGFDKNAEVPGAMLRAGFGFVECGTVTPKPQAGNPRPRLFRLTADKAVINRMGFNNRGLDAFRGGLIRRGGYPVGANVGANKDSIDRIADYVTCIGRLWAIPDWFTINISSPNTPGLRALQTRAALDELLGRVMALRSERGDGDGPFFLKVAPDLQDDEIEQITEASVANGINALIVSNTTIARPETLVSAAKGEAGGLSGAPLFAPSTRVLKRFHQAAAGRLPLIGAGGIGSGADAYAKIRAGASAVQLYSALVFSGPGLVDVIRRDLAARLRADGFTHVSEAVGV